MKDPNTIYVIIEEGLVQEVINIPEGRRLLVIDKDTEGADPTSLKVNPLGGKPCFITKFPYETKPDRSTAEGTASSDKGREESTTISGKVLF